MEMRFFRLMALSLCLSTVFWGCTSLKTVEPESHAHSHSHGKSHGKATRHPHNAGMHHDFSDAAKWSKMFDNPKRAGWQKPKEVVSLMKIKAKMKVADVGAGTGYFLPHLDKAVGPGGQVLGLDVEASLVAHMKKRIHRQKLKATEARLIAMDDPQLAKGSMDRILIVDTWHHIGQRPAYSAKLKKALAPGGQVVIVDFEPGAKGPGPKQHHRLSSEQVIQELKKGGLKARAIRESLPYQYIVIATN